MSPDANRAPTLAVAGGLAIVYLLWGSTYLGIALAIETMPPMLMAAARFLIAGALLYVIVRLSARSARRPTGREWGAAALSGLPMLAGGNGGVVWAQQTVPSGIAALMIASVALWIVILDRAF